MFLREFGEVFLLGRDELASVAIFGAVYEGAGKLSGPSFFVCCCL